MTPQPILSHLLVLGTLAFAGTAALAGPSVPAGELIDAALPVNTLRSTLSRSEVTSEVRVARRAGTLLAAGEGPMDAAVDRAGAPVRSRAEVKAEVLAARAAGTLMAAGEIERTNRAGPASVLPRIEMARSAQAGSLK